MCGRFSQFSDVKKMAQDLGVPEAFFKRKIVPRYNVAPSLPVLTLSKPNDYEVEYRKWGLVPVWAKDPAIGNRMINARSETVEEKPSFRGPFKNSRCLIPADGFFEWKRDGNSKQPYYIRLKSEAVLTFAGLSSHWVGGDGSELETCTILTTGPNSLMKPIHERMPVILGPEAREAWLDKSLVEVKKLKTLLEPYPAKEMEAYPVSTLVNTPKNNIPECLIPLK